MKIENRGRGIILFKDFGSILSMNRDARKSVLAAFREIYDGEWTRTLGTDGGRSYTWKGKVGAIGAVTEDIERLHSVMATMGERFLLYRMPRLNDSEREIRIKKAMEHGSNVEQMRDDLKSAVYTLFKDGLQETEAPNSEQNRIPADLAMVVASWRSSVIRNGHSRDIELVPETEVPTRIAKNFQQLQQGFRAIGLNEDAARELLVRVGLDSIPLVRGKILRLLIEGSQSTADISERLVGYSRTTIDRHLTEVRAHRGVEVRTLERGQQPRWTLPKQIAERLTRLGVGPASESANDGERSTSNTREGLADHRQPEKSETARPISEKSESGE
jgi:DNA-binding transcriptional ArsR family regulator